MIRVLIMDQGYKSYYHEEMQIEFQGNLKEAPARFMKQVRH